MLARLFIVFFCISPFQLFAQVSNDPSFEYIYEIDSVTNRKVHLNADKMPAFTDTTITFHDFFTDNFNYVGECDFHSKIVIAFIVEPNGEITSKRIVRKPDCDISNEIMRVLDSLPKMKPGIIQGKPVPVLRKYAIEIK